MLAKYQKLTDKEHILKKPDTYLGSIDKNEQTMFIFENNKIIEKNISFIPALFKLFDEGIVNCRDHVVRQQHAISNKQENALPV